MPTSEADFPFLPAYWSMNMDNGQYRAKRMNQTLAEEPGNEQRSEREGQPLGPPEIKAPLTQAGVSNWRILTENCKRGVQKTIVTPLSALAENFIPRKTSRKPPTPQMPTDNELNWSFARTGLKKIETPQDIIEIDITTVGAASPTDIEKPVAMADVAGASGPAIAMSQWPGHSRSR